MKFTLYYEIPVLFKVEAEADSIEEAIRNVNVHNVTNDDIDDINTKKHTLFNWEESQ